MESTGIPQQRPRKFCFKRPQTLSGYSKHTPNRKVSTDFSFNSSISFMQFIIGLLERNFMTNLREYAFQVALIVFLAHIGSFVPAEAATVGLTDRIFCAMGSKLMTAEQSTFMIDLHQVGVMLRQATSRSLCLLDEFGKGTLTEDGIGLLGGTINHFVTCGDCPKVLVCTHLTEIFSESCLLKSETIKFYTMSVLRPDNNCANIEDIVFLYRLVPGHALLSYGLHCALLAGVPEEVLKRAAFVLEANGNSKQVERLCDEKILIKDRQYKDAVDKLLVFDVLKGDLSHFFQDMFSSEL
ncbi:hypothetical protein GIB67_011602 [Kingdonia uniflora]|uniref:DNA mismatch repair protein MSH5 n=1 Tax=Kingdonia uniflora TaxID=39325 RepID=A0A7J7NLZ4_9MAGN|nr:hypothetical protein GIB67_011602 [Kingdonia uniflora]